MCLVYSLLLLPSMRCIRAPFSACLNCLLWYRSYGWWHRRQIPVGTGTFGAQAGRHLPILSVCVLVIDQILVVLCGDIQPKCTTATRAYAPVQQQWWDMFHFGDRVRRDKCDTRAMRGTAQEPSTATANVWFYNSRKKKALEKKRSSS